MSMRTPRSRIVFLLAGTLAMVSLVAGVRPAAAEMHPNTRGGWFLGFGVGGGTAELTSGSASSGREGAFAASLRAGYDFTPELGLGLESNGWTKSQDVSGGTVTTTLNVAAATLYYHPPATGLVLRGGVGVGSADASFQSGSTKISGSTSGFGFTVGAQYDFRVLRSFSIGPQVDYGWMTLDPFDANYFNFGLSFDWHFIGQ